jgi:hypothetical protein
MGSRHLVKPLQKWHASYLKKGGTPQKRWPTSKKATHLKKGNPSPKKATHPHQKWQPKRGSATDNIVLGVACIVDWLIVNFSTVEVALLLP